MPIGHSSIGWKNGSKQTGLVRVNKHAQKIHTSTGRDTEAIVVTSTPMAKDPPATKTAELGKEAVVPPADSPWFTRLVAGAPVGWIVSGVALGLVVGAPVG